MAKKSWHLDRRTVLKGLGMTCLLPQLEAMAEPKSNQNRNIKRAAMVFFPNGCSIAQPNQNAVHQWGFFPQSDDPNYKATNVLQPLQKHRDNFTLIGGLSHPKSRTLVGHAAGDTFLTGGDIRGDYNNRLSLDQAFAGRYGRLTRLPYLSLSVDGGTGYKSRCSTLSFDRNGTAIPSQANLQAIFDRMFGSSNAQENKEMTRRRLILGKKSVDFIMADAKSLGRRLGKNDQQKVKQYLASVSDLEDRIKRSEMWLDRPIKKVDSSHIKLGTPVKNPKEFIRAMYDLIAIGFEADITRTAAYMIAREDGIGHGDKWPSIAMSLPGWHNMQHAKGEKSVENWGKWDAFLSEQFAYFLDRLKAMEDRNGTSVLDNTMILYGSAQSTTHNSRNYPLILAGAKNMGLEHGRYLKYDDKTPLSNLQHAMLQTLDCKEKTWADSTAQLTEKMRKDITSKV